MNNERCVPGDQAPISVPLRWRFAAAALVVIALFTALYMARTVMLPIAIAFVLSFLLTPLVLALQRLHVPRVLGAGLVVAGMVALLAAGVALLSMPAQQWLERAPQVAQRVEQRLELVTQALRKFTRATEHVEALAGGTRAEEVPVKVQGPGLRGLILTSTWELAAGAAMLVFLLYFLLASGNLFLRRLVQVLPRLQDKKIAVTVVRHIRTDVTRYLLTVTMINAVLGIVVAAAMALLQMPNPILWGVLAAVLNFVPYLGPAVVLSVIAAVSLLTFDSFGEAVVRPFAFLVLTSLEGQLVTPYILGRRLMLNPVAIFVSLIFWAWLWGIAGALLAVPLTMIIKIVCDAVPPLAPIGTFLAR